MTDECAKLHPEKSTKQVKKNLANQLLTFGILVKRPFEQRPASKPAIESNSESLAKVLSMPNAHQGRAGFILSTAAEIKNIRDMAIYDSSEAFVEAHMKISKISIPKIVFTKKYHSDGNCV